MFGFFKKLGMTRLFIDGKTTPVTVVELVKSYPLQRKTKAKDGYSAIQMGAVKTRKITKPLAGHLKKSGDVDFGLRLIEEFQIPEDVSDFNFTIDQLKIGDLLKVTGTSKGSGFTGVIKRYDFAGQPATRGHDHVRAVGSIGTRWPQRTLPGKKMAGRAGSETKTLPKVKLLEIDVEKKLLFVKGPLPGANGGYLKFTKV